MARTNQELTQQEVIVFQEFAKQNGIRLSGSEGASNGDVLGGPIMEAGNDITEQTLSDAFKQVWHSLVFDSTQAQKLSSWMAATQGRSGTLENQGELGLDVYTNLLEELSGRDVNPETINAAIARIQGPQSKYSVRQRRALHYVPAAIKVDPRSHAATDDGTRFLGNVVNEPLWKRKQRERSEREAQSAQTKPVEPQNAWDKLVQDILQDGSHSQQASLREQYNREVSQGKSSREIYSKLNELRLTYKRLLPTAKF